jgi:DNA-directed RNA polymerase subunit RPC12/RpoP
MNISEKVAYIKGLAEGMKLDKESNEGRMILAIVDVLQDIAEELEIIDDTLDDMAEVVGDLEEDVKELEEELYGSSDYDDYEDYDDDALYEITCRKCGNKVAIDMSMLDDDVISCPGCGEKIEIEIDFDGECDCPDCRGEQ